MTLPVLTALAIVFIVWINYEIHKNSKLSKEDTESFWNREKASNLIRRTDISNLDYITISTEQLPITDNSDSTINSYRDTILGLSGKKAINLSSFTNTELKLVYGTANINELTEYDNNYTILVSILHKWAERLYILGNIKEAISVLEYAVFCHTDVTKSYPLLAQLYKSANNSEEIQKLIDNIPTTLRHDQNKLILELNKIKNS